MRARPRVDANQTEIVSALRRVGCRVQSLAAIGKGCPDLLVLSPFTRSLHLLEIKDGTKVPSARRLTPDEQRFADEWGIVHVVESVEDALRVVGGCG